MGKRGGRSFSRVAPWALCLAASAGLAAAEEVTPLKDGWAIQSARKVTTGGEALSKPGAATEGWYPTRVPSTVVAVLVENKLFPDPYFADNFKKLPGTDYPFGKNFSNMEMPADSPFRDPWWYRTEFAAPPARNGRRYWLRFNGINYRADIWLNGHKLAGKDEVAGAYRRYEFDATTWIRPGGVNALAVEVFAPTPKDLAITWVDWNPGPPDKNMGLWMEVALATSGPVALRHPYVMTKLESLEAAHLTVFAEAVNATDQPVQALVRGSIEEIAFEKTVALGPKERREIAFDPAELPQLRVSKPRLWWPYTMGTPNLHDLKLHAMVGGEVSDRQKLRFGIREISSEITTNKECLQLKVNGRKVLIRGGGWASDILLRRNPDRLEAELRYVKEMNLNTVRPEGKLEAEEFYDIADREGIFVMPGWCCCDQWEKWKEWSDENRKVSAASQRDQLLRLRSRASVLAWLNSSDMVPPADVEKVYLDVAKQVRWPNPLVSSASEDKSSVSGPSGVKMNGPYDYIPPNYWLLDDKNGGAFCFNTETCRGPAIPPIEGLKQMLPADRLWPINELWKLHAGGDVFSDFKLFNQGMSARYGPPKGLEDYVWKSQAMAYEGERAMFEAFARNKYAATGIIQWMLNNGWPSLIWHLYDYYLRPAGGYYGTKKASEPVHVMFSYDDQSVAVSNDLAQALPGMKLSAKVYDLQASEKFSKEAVVELPADATIRPFTIPRLKGLSTTYFLRLRLHDPSGKLVSSNFYWLSTKPDVFNWKKTTWWYTPVKSFGDLRGLQELPPANVEVSSFRSEDVGDEGRGRVALRNTGSGLAFLVRLKLTDGKSGAEILPVFWEDNYFELFPGEERSVQVAYRRKDRKGVIGDVALEVDGWNVKPGTMAAAR